MGFLNGSNRILASLKVDKKGVFAFRTKKKENGSWIDDETHKQFTGEIQKMTMGSYFWEGDLIHTLKIEAKDETDNYLIEANLNIPVRSLLNSLFYHVANGGSLVGQTLYIRVYNKKIEDKEKEVPGIYVELNGEKLDWLFKDEDLPEIKKVKVKGKEVSDDTEINNFFISKFNELILPQFQTSK